MIAITKIVGELFDLVKGQPLGHSVVISNGLSDRTVEVSDEFIMMVLMLKQELDENTQAPEEGPGPQPQVYSAPVPQKAKASNGQRQAPLAQRPAPVQQQPEDENEVYSDPDSGASSL